MKKLFLILAAVGVMGFSAVNVYAQETESQAPEADATEQVVAEVETEVVGNSIIFRESRSRRFPCL